MWTIGFNSVQASSCHQTLYRVLCLTGLPNDKAFFSPLFLRGFLFPIYFIIRYKPIYCRGLSVGVTVGSVCCEGLGAIG